jgi:thiol-disulfide isomerase/thioredoxin
MLKLILSHNPLGKLPVLVANKGKSMNRLNRYLFIFILMLCTASQVLAQNKYSIKGNIKGLKDTKVYLANYYGNKLYYNDTTEVDSKGNFTFKGKPYNECGKYAFVMPGPKYFDFIVAEENIVIEADSSNKIEAIKIKESENNKIFFDYIRYINDKRKAREPMDKILMDSTKTDAEKTPYRDQLKKLNDEVIAYQKSLVAKNPDLLVTKLIKMSMDIEVPEAPAELTQEEKNKWSYYYYRNHYWDNCDLKDPRLVRDQAFHKLVERFSGQTLPQIPDTMCTQVRQLIERTSGNTDAFKYIVHHFTYYFETSKIMCMDEGFVYMVDNYYAKGLCDWMKKEKIEEMKTAANEKRNCLCGEVGPDIILPDVNDQWKSMYAMNNKYTILVIWESTCGHCKKEIPKLLDVYHKWQDVGLGVYAVHNNLEKDKWLKFIDEHHLDWTNVARSSGIMNQDSATKLVYGGITTLQSLNYHQYWDVNSTPKVFLLDKDHKVIAKSLSAEQLDELISRLEQGGAVDPTKLENHEYEDEDEETPGNKPKGRPAQQPKQIPGGKTGTGGTPKSTPPLPKK